MYRQRTQPRATGICGDLHLVQPHIPGEPNQHDYASSNRNTHLESLTSNAAHTVCTAAGVPGAERPAEQPVTDSLAPLMDQARNAVADEVEPLFGLLVAAHVNFFFNFNVTWTAVRNGTGASACRTASKSTGACSASGDLKVHTANAITTSLPAARRLAVAEVCHRTLKCMASFLYTHGNVTRMSIRNFPNATHTVSPRRKMPVSSRAAALQEAAIVPFPRASLSGPL